MIHGFNFTDDWGTQQALIIRLLSAGFFQAALHPPVRRHSFRGWHVWMHSCGKVNAILGDLIEAGVTWSIYSSRARWTFPLSVNSSRTVVF